MNESVDIVVKLQSEFPLREEYAKKFEIDEYTVFALFPNIYTNYPLTPDLLIHESQHLKQQTEIGVTEWVYDFLEYPQRRLFFEIDAYKAQLRSIKDREKRNKVRIESARNLSSGLYGNIISYTDAFNQLKV